MDNNVLVQLDEERFVRGLCAASLGTENMLVIPEQKKYDSSDRSIYYIVPIPFGPRQLLIISRSGMGQHK